MQDLAKPSQGSFLHTTVDPCIITAVDRDANQHTLLKSSLPSKGESQHVLDIATFTCVASIMYMSKVTCSLYS